MYEKTTLDGLTQNSVSVKTQKFIVQDGQEYAIGEPHRKTYTNSQCGRGELTALPEPYLSAVMAVWVDTATIIEEGVENQ